MTHEHEEHEFKSTEPSPPLPGWLTPLARADAAIRSRAHHWYQAKTKFFTAFFFGTSLGRWIAKHTTANTWTYVRYPLAAITVLLIYLRLDLVAVFTIILTCLTDLLDGALATFKDKASISGGVGDSIADWVFETFVGLQLIFRGLPVETTWLIALVLTVDLVRFSGAIVGEAKGIDQGAFSTTMSGRYKGLFTVIGSMFILLHFGLSGIVIGFPPLFIGLANVFIGLALACSLISFRRHWLKFRSAHRSRR